MPYKACTRVFTCGSIVSTCQVRLQLASGAFLLTDIYSDCLQIPLDRLKRASPYSLHRRSLSPPFRCTSPSAPSLSTSAKPPSAPTFHHVTFSLSSCALTKPTTPPFHHTPDDTTLMLVAKLPRRHPSDRDPVTSPPELHSSEEGSLELSVGPSPSQGQADSGRGSETDICEGASIESAALLVSNQLAQEELESSSWATAVALAWLEHRCAGYFMEWELVAAKADFWLRCQHLPEGLDMAGLRGAARQLFLLLRHWDENIKLNMLCYNPNNVWASDFPGNPASTETPTLVSNEAADSHSQEILHFLCRISCNAVPYQDDHKMSHWQKTVTRTAFFSVVLCNHNNALTTWLSLFYLY